MSKLKTAIIVDLDGTLTNCDHRLFHVKKKPKDWKAFFDKMEDDEIHSWCEELILAMQARGHAIILLTGRPEDYREPTQKWLSRYQIPYDLLLMRAQGDHREDAQIKWELYQREIAPKYRALFCVEDRAGVVAMWREKGIPTLQCDLGDF